MLPGKGGFPGGTEFPFGERRLDFFGSSHHMFSLKHLLQSLPIGVGMTVG